MKKFMALVLVGVMAFGMTTMAAESPSAAAVAAADPATVAGTVEYQAASVQMSVGEYVNNAVVSTPGLDSTTTYKVGSGEKCIVNGVASNARLTLRKADKSTVESAKAQAAKVGGTVMNVVATSANCQYTTLGVNFYMPKVVAGQKIAVYQLIDGVWTPVTVNEIRQDHVVVTLSGKGAVMFVAM